MLINRNNYESYFLDFLEGRLPEKEADELMAFLKVNPDLEDSLINFNNYKIESSGELSFNKQFLFKTLDNFESINESNFDEFCIAWYENELSENSSRAFLEYLQANPFKNKDFDAYGKTFLKPDLNISFPHKSRLKKFTLSGIYRLAYIASAVAAAIFLYFSIFPFNKHSIQKPAQEIAVRNTISSSQTQNRSHVLTTTLPVNTNRIQKTRLPKLKSDRSNTKKTVISNQSDSSSLEIKNLAFLDHRTFNSIQFQLSSNNPAMLELAHRNNPPAGTAEYPNLREYAMNEIKKLRNSNFSGTRPNSSLTFWDIAKLGVSGINNITGSDIKLNRTIDDKGKITAMAFQSGSLGFSRSISK